VKKHILLFSFLFIGTISFTQDTTSTLSKKEERRLERRNRVNAVIKQEEEGVLAYTRQNSFGVQIRTDGYGFFYEHGRTQTPRFTNLYLIEITEIKHRKEEKATQTDGFFSSSYIYGKINNFYQAKLGFGQQYILGQKGNKNGIAVMGIYQGGLSMGLLRPYYLNVNDGTSSARDIKYESVDSVAFLTGRINGSSSFGKGWNELKIRPGAFVKGALRFDFGRYNEMISAVQIGFSVEGYAQKIPLMVYNEPERLFYQAHLAFLFGRRK
jgi:hypothetical protein